MKHAQRKACQNIVPKHSENHSSAFPSPPKSRPEASWGAKMHPKGTSDQPSDAQERPRGGQEALKRLQKPPKSSQKPAKRRPRGIQNSLRPLPSRAWHAPRRVWSTILVESSVRQALGAILCCFWSCAQHVRFVQNFGKTWEKLWFLHIRRFCAR